MPLPLAWLYITPVCVCFQDGILHKLHPYISVFYYALLPYRKDELCLLKYKFNILSEFKKHGYKTTTIRQNKIMGERQLQTIRDGQVTISNINIICQLLDCQPGDILEYVPDDKAID